MMAVTKNYLEEIINFFVQICDGLLDLYMFVSRVLSSIMPYRE